MLNKKHKGLLKDLVGLKTGQFWWRQTGPPPPEPARFSSFIQTPLWVQMQTLSPVPLRHRRAQCKKTNFLRSKVAAHPLPS